MNMVLKVRINLTDSDLLFLTVGKFIKPYCTSFKVSYGKL
jgi:hypothetical protein